MLNVDAERGIAWIQFYYDPKKIEKVKAVPTARWNPEARRWEVHAAYAPALARAIGEEAGDGLDADGVLLEVEPAEDGWYSVRLFGPYPKIREIAKSAGLAWSRPQKGYTGLVTGAALEELKRAADLTIEREGEQEPIPLPDDLPHKPWPHQEAGWRFVTGLWKRGWPGAMLYWDMGTGKTFTALLLARSFRRVLVLAPRSVVAVWTQQAEKHLPNAFSVVSLARGSTTHRAGRLAKALEEDADRPLIVVVNYESFWRNQLWETIRGTRWDLLILDESHRVKSPDGKAAKAAHELGDATPRKLLLTGTPMPHSPLDLWSQFRVLDPGVFGKSFYRFRNRYAILGPWRNVEGFQHLKELRAKMTSRTHRVRRDDVLELPPIQHIPVPVELGSEWLVYLDLLETRLAELDKTRIDVEYAIVLINKLAQVTSGFVIDDEGITHRVGSAKADALADLLADLPKDEPVVVFARYQADLDRIHEVAKAAGRTSLELSGRRDEWERFAKGEGDLLAVQFRAGSLGVDLTRAAYGIVYSYTYSLGDYEQAMARLHRPGQTRSVAIYHLVAKGTINEDIIKALEHKRDVIQAVVKGLKRRT